MTTTISTTPLNGVFPVLPTPFHAEGAPDPLALRRLVRYLIQSGANGVTYPGVASEVETLTLSERESMMLEVLDEACGKVPVIAGISSQDPAVSVLLARIAVDAGAAALMVAAPANRPQLEQQIAFFAEVARAAGDTPIMLQNVPAPNGAGLSPEDVLAIAKQVPAVRYVKEETLPCGQRITYIAAHAPVSLIGIFGGAGGRYVTDELARGVAGTMPAIDLAELHVALYGAHLNGNRVEVRRLFERMLPILNMQAVFRWALTKEILLRRGLLDYAAQRSKGPHFDQGDHDELTEMLDDLRDLLPIPYRNQ